MMARAATVGRSPPEEKGQGAPVSTGRKDCSGLETLIKDNFEALQDIAASLLPPGCMARIPGYNAEDVLEEALLKVWQRGSVPEGYEFLTYMWFALRREGHAAWAKAARRAELRAEYCADLEEYCHA